MLKGKRGRPLGAIATKMLIHRNQLAAVVAHFEHDHGLDPLTPASLQAVFGEARAPSVEQYREWTHMFRGVTPETPANLAELEGLVPTLLDKREEEEARKHPVSVDELFTFIFRYERQMRQRG